MKVWTDKEGKKLTASEFMERFKQGIASLTPLQKITHELRGTFISTIGFIASLIAVILFRETIGLLAYGLILIFIGSTWTTGIKWISLMQQHKFLKELEKEVKDVR